MMRLLRLWRLMNSKELPESVRAFVEHYFRSEMGLTVLSILKLLCLVIWVNHLLACVWHEIANQSNDGRNWVEANNLSDESMLYRYVTAVHWSITQFFCGASDIHPTNLEERAFAIAVLFGTIMMSASIISSLTTSMTRLSIAAAEETRKFAVLRDYLSENHISARVSLRVQRNARYALYELRRHTLEQDVELLALVSQPLLVELHFEMNMPSLRHHPFFQLLGEECPDLLRKICHEVVSSLSISNGDLLFSQGVTNVQHMYFLTIGKLLYVQTEIKDDMFMGQKRSFLEVGDWACEAVLWTTWSHVGSMRAKSECKLSMLSSETFRNINLDFKAALPFASDYATRFVRQLNKLQHSELTDLAHPDCDYYTMALAARRHDLETFGDMHRSRLSRVMSGHHGAIEDAPAVLPVLPGEAKDDPVDNGSDAGSEGDQHRIGSLTIKISQVHPDSE